MKVSYTCKDCGGSNVQLNYPCWVNANDIDDKDSYEVDFEARPEQDHDKRWCVDCDRNVHFIKHEEEEPAEEVRTS